MPIDVMGAILAGIDLPSMRGLEIGALYHPRVTKDQSDVRYVDHATTDDLRRKYAEIPDAAPHMGEIVEVDYVATPGKRLVDVVGDWAPVDYVIASHVLEHVPNPAEWLRQVGELLVAHGVLSLVVPDKRFCFDARRATTTLAQIIDADLREVSQPTFQQIFDCESNFIGPVGAEDLWAGLDPQSRTRDDKPNPRQYALERCLEQMTSGEYFDTHASVFTPASFVEIMDGLAELDRMPFAIAELTPTPRGFLEFYVTLENLSCLAPKRRRDWQRAAVARAREALVDQPEPGPEPEPEPEPLPPGTHEAAISGHEQRLIDAKRRVLFALRHPRITVRDHAADGGQAASR